MIFHIKSSHIAASLLLIVFAIILTAAAPTIVLADDTEDILSDNGLPVVYISLPEGEIEKINTSENHSYMCESGTVTVTVPEGYKGDYSNDPIDDSLTRDLSIEYIRGRGHSTWKLDKKPYKFKLDKKADLLGMGKDKSWVLLADRIDATSIRNRFSMYMADKLSLMYTPKCLPVDLVINGSYEGSYLLSQNVKTGSTRIDIDELTDNDISGSAVTGGYILALHPYAFEPAENVFKTDRLVPFELDTPTFHLDETGKQEGQPEQRAYIMDYVQKTENSIFGDGFKDEDGVSYSEYMDVDSAINYWWVQELTHNIDAFITSSTYLYKKRDGKLYWGPVWDMDLSMAGYLDPSDPFAYTKGFDFRPMIWLDYLRTYDADYREKLKARWNKVDALVEEALRDGGTIDTMAEEIRASWHDDFRKWGGFEQSSGWPNTDESFDKLIGYLKEWLRRRRAWINDNLNDETLTRAYHSVDYKVDGKVWKTEYYSISTKIDPYPFPPEKKGFVFKYWQQESDGKIIREDNSVNEDMTLVPVYVKSNETTPLTNIFFKDRDAWADLSGKVYIPEMVCVPSWYDACTVKWSSSDPDVATVGSAKSGAIYLKSTGVTTITATMMSGKKASYKLTVYDPLHDRLNEPSSITADIDSLVIKPGKYGQINTSLSPKPCVQDISFSSSDTGICKVGKAGNVTALSPGIAVITYNSFSQPHLNGTVTVTVTKYDNTLKAKARPVTIKASALRRKSRSISIKKAMNITGAIGKITYSKVKVVKAKYKTKFRVNKNTGCITVSKGLKKGIYKITVKVRAAGDEEHLSASKNVTVRIKVN